MYGLGYGDDAVDFSVLEGQTLLRAKNNGDTMFFETVDGRAFVMGHVQDCCESVRIDEIHGDLEDLVGSPLLIAEEASGKGGSKEDWCESSTWTFYKLATVRGHVTIRWLGESNGYYSESVSLYEKKVEPEN